MKKKQKEIRLRIPQKEIRFKIPQIDFKKCGIVLMVVFLVVVGKASAGNGGGTIWDIIGRTAGEIIGNNISRQVENQEISLGAVTSPDLYNPYFRYGDGDGIRVWQTARKLITATNTPCAIQSPAATSTLQSAGIKFDVSTTSASVVGIGLSTSSNNSTSTQIGANYAITATEKAFINASTTPSAGAKEVLAPSTWVVFNMYGSGANAGGTVSPVGACHATFEEYLSL